MVIEGVGGGRQWWEMILSVFNTGVGAHTYLERDGDHLVEHGNLFRHRLSLTPPDSKLCLFIETLSPTTTRGRLLELLHPLHLACL
jgi:hypothetical protein